MWTKNFQMYKLDLERQRNQRSNCQHPFDHKKGKRIPEKKNLLCFIDYVKAFDCVDHGKLWKILKEMGIPDHLICLMWNWYAGPEAIVRTGHETTAWFQIGKGVCQGCILSLCLFYLYAEYITRNARLDEAQARIKIAGRQIYGHGKRGGEGEMYGKSNMEAYTTICKIDSQQGFAVCLWKLKQGLCINLERWDEEGAGREVQKGGNIYVYLWLLLVEVWQKTKIL